MEESQRGQITSLLYKPEVGLIVTGFLGYIELFDSILFQSKGHIVVNKEGHNFASTDAKVAKKAKTGAIYDEVEEGLGLNARSSTSMSVGQPEKKMRRKIQSTKRPNS